MVDRTDKPLHELSLALQEFAASTRFNFLKTLQVGRFVQNTGGSLGIVSEFTFEKLVELGTRKLMKLKWLNAQQEEQLVKLLRALTKGEPVPTLSPPVHSASAFDDETVQGSSDGEVLGSVQVEISLRENLRKIRAHPDWESLRHQPFGTFWDPTWTRAPFEEALTVEQLAELDLTMLLKKKTMTNQRIWLMAKALEQAMGESVKPALSARVRPESTLAPLRLVHSAEPETPLPSLTEVAEHPWLTELEGVNPVVRIAVESFLLACRRAATAPAALDRALTTLSEELGGHDFLALVGLGCATRGYEPERYRTLVDSTEFQRSIAPVQGLLASPGVALSRIADLLNPSYFPGSVRDLCAQVLARLLGAVEVSLAGKVCDGVWTCNPELVPLITQAASRGPQPFLDNLKRICPSLDPTLHSWLCDHGPKSRRRGARGTRKILPN